MFLTILQYIACGLTILVGAFSLFSPISAGKFTGLSPEGGRGITEIRAVLGMFFVALERIPLFSPLTQHFTCWGSPICWSASQD